VVAVQPNLFPPPELPPETRISLEKLPGDAELGPLQPDSDFVRTVEELGVYNPICLKRKKGGYIVVEGKRRVKAARKVGQKMVPCRIFSEDWNDADIVQIALHEQRKPNPISELEAFEGALARGDTIETIRRRTGIKQQKVRVLLKLQNLIPELRAAMSDGRIKPSVAHLAAKLPKKDQKKLIPVLLEEGRIKVSDVQEVQIARRQDAQAQLPASLFEDEGDWMVASLSKLKELRAILEPRGRQFTSLLDELEKKIRK